MGKHIPVLLSEVLELLDLRPGMKVVDATLGQGGYGREIVRKIAPGGVYIGIDLDAEAVRRVECSDWVSRARENGVSVFCVLGNFSDVQSIVEKAGVFGADAAVADLGVSSDQLEDERRGLSFTREGPLDMRLDRSQLFTALEIVNGWSEQEIRRILWNNVQERDASRIARAIVKARPIKTTLELAEVVQRVRASHREKTHPATKTFLAIRMEVNHEMQNLSRLLDSCLRIIRVGGRAAFVTFHSGEDREVKKFFREAAKGCVCPERFPVCRCGHRAMAKILTKRSIVPREKEISENPRSRSARLRAIQKIGNE